MHKSAEFTEVRSTLVLYGGQSGSGALLSDTWELGPSGSWVQNPTTNNPGGLSGQAMAFFAGVGTVQFGGVRIGGPIDETWEYDGSQWLLRVPPARPSARSNHAMAYDTLRNRVVLFGGLGTSGPLADTWEWDGTSWLQLSPVQSPPAREGHAMAYDAIRRLVVLTGGNAGNQVHGDSWLFDAAAGRWTREPSPPWSPRTRHAMAFDPSPTRNRLVMFGGSVQGQATDETWEWFAGQWRLVPSSGPSRRFGHALAFDAVRQRIVLTGGTDAGFSQISSTWEWDGTQWTNRFGNLGPTGREGHSLTFDSIRGVSTLIGGQNASINTITQVFDWNGTQWLRQRPAISPPPLQGHAAAFDDSRGVHVVFAYPPSPAGFNETWEWNGTQWAQVRTGLDAMRPTSRREGAALAYDSLRQQVIMFGGLDGSYFAETREWRVESSCSCRVWQLRSPAVSPSGRSFHAMAYDRRRDRIVLFGGTRGSSLGFGDTWEWDGTTWALRSPAQSPPPRFNHVMAFDSARARIVLFGGISGATTLNDVWEWDGTTWSVRSTAQPPAGRVRSAMTFDPLRGNLVVFGGENAGTYFGDTLTLGPAYPATFTLGGTGCPGSAGTPMLDANLGVTPWNLPWRTRYRRRLIVANRARQQQ